MIHPISLGFVSCHNNITISGTIISHQHIIGIGGVSAIRDPPSIRVIIQISGRKMVKYQNIFAQTECIAFRRDLGTGTEKQQ